MLGEWVGDDARIPTPGRCCKEWVRGGKKGTKEGTIDSGNECGREILVTLGTLGNWKVGVRNVLAARNPPYHPQQGLRRLEDLSLSLSPGTFNPSVTHCSCNVVQRVGPASHCLGLNVTGLATS